MQIVILTDYARNPLFIFPMGFVFSLYCYYIGQFVKIENMAILEPRACQNCTFREAYFVQQDKLIFGLSNCRHRLGLGGMAQIVCVARLQSVLQKLTYN
jgi:hypothetical protein